MAQTMTQSAVPWLSRQRIRQVASVLLWTSLVREPFSVNIPLPGTSHLSWKLSSPVQTASGKPRCIAGLLPQELLRLEGAGRERLSRETPRVRE